MPIIQLQTNVSLNLKKKKKILVSISQLAADIMRKPVSDVMMMYSYCDLMIAGTFERAAFVDLRCVSGFNVKVAGELCEGISLILQNEIAIDLSRIYVNFFEVSEVHAWRFVNSKAVYAESKTGEAKFT